MISSEDDEVGGRVRGSDVGEVRIEVVLKMCCNPDRSFKSFRRKGESNSC